MNISEITFDSFSLRINGVLLALLFAVLLWRFYTYLQKERRDTVFFLQHFWRWLLGALVVGRLFAILLDPTIISDSGFIALLMPWEGGFNLLGMIIGGVSTLFYDLRNHPEDALEWLDLAVFPLLFGIVIADLLAFFTGSQYGIETSLPWGIRYETFDIDIVAPVHPIGLYAFFLHLVLYRLLMRYENDLLRTSGKLALYTFLGYCMIELVLQFVRGEPTLTLYGMIRVEHIMYLIAFIYAYYRARKITKEKI